MKKTFILLAFLSLISQSCAHTINEPLPTIVSKAEKNVSGTVQFELQNFNDEELTRLSETRKEIKDVRALNCKIERLFTKGMPKNKVYSLHALNMAYNSQFLGDFKTNDGEVLINVDNPQEILGQMPYVFGQNFMNGEPVYYLLISKDSTVSFALTHIPNPIEYKWEDNAHFFLKLGDTEGQFFSLFGKGFKPNEILDCDSISGKETSSFQLPTDSNGCVAAAAIAPAVIGQKGGSAQLIISRKGDAGKGFISYLWGDLAQQIRK